MICPKCKKEEEHHAKGLCYNCYRKFAWERKKFVCKRCKRKIPLHAKGLCQGCYNFVFHLDKSKELNYRKDHDISAELYKEITKKCVICEFNKIVELHHLDGNKKNNARENLIGLCPNHHKMVHNFKFRKEIRELLEQKGFNLPEDKKLDFKLTNI